MFAETFEFDAKIALESFKGPELMLTVDGAGVEFEAVVLAWLTVDATTELPGTNGLMNCQKMALTPFDCN